MQKDKLKVVKFPFYQQQNEWDCSLACIYMLFQHYHANKITYFQFIKENNYFQDLNLLQMQQVADQYGIFLAAYLVKWNDFDQTKITKPLICQIQKNNQFHFIVIYQKKKKSYLIADPWNDYLVWIKIQDLQKMYTGVVLRSEKTIWQTITVENPGDFMLWNNLLLPSIITVMMGILITICTIFIQFLMKMLIDDVIVKGIKQLLMTIIVGLSLLYSQKIILQLLFNLAINKIEINFKKKWNLKLLNRLKKLSFIDYQKYKIHNIVQNYHYFNEILNFHFPVSLDIIKGSLIIIASLSIIVIINTNIVLPILLLITLFFLLYFVLHPYILQYERTVIQWEKKWQNNFLDFCRHYLSYKNRNLVLWRSHELFEDITKQFQLFQEKNYWVNIQLIINELFAGLKTLIIIYLLLGTQKINNDNPGIFIFLFALINNIISHSQNLFQNLWYGFKIKDLKKRVYPFLLQTAQEKPTPASKNIIKKIVLQNCNISLDGLHDIWQDNLNLSVKKTLVVCGISGAGKTILFQILSNYWKKYKGKIFINDHNLQTINTNDYQNEVYLLEAYAPIFNGTVFENITTYQKHKNILPLWKQININYFLNLIQLSASSEITNNTISNGQRQIINFLALFFRPESLFLLDESLNSIPHEWKTKLLAALINFKAKNIICYATHDHKIIDQFTQKITLKKNESQN